MALFFAGFDEFRHAFGQGVAEDWN